MCNWIGAIIYGLFPVVVVLVVVSSAEGAKKIIVDYMTSLVWIGLWPILFAIINHPPLTHLRYKARAPELAIDMPFQLTGAFDTMLTNEQVTIGYMVVPVSLITEATTKLGQGGFVGVIDRMMTGFAPAGTAVGVNNTSDSVGMNQTGLGTASASMASTNKYDSNIGLQGGGATVDRGNGSTTTMAANGAVALQQLQNQIPMQMNMSHRLGAGHNQEAHHTDITSTGDRLARRHGGSSSLTDVKGRDITRDQYQNTGVVAAHGSEGGYGGQHPTGQNLGRNLHGNPHFHTAADAGDQLHMNLGVGRGNPNGGGALGVDGAGGTPDPREEERIADAMKRGGMNQQQVDQALKNYRGGKGGAWPPSGLINADLGYNSARICTAEYGRDRGVDTVHGNQKTARTKRAFAERGSRTEQAETGNQSAQSDRHGRDAVLINVDKVSRICGVSDRREFGTGDRANRGDSDSFTTYKDPVADPYLFEKVATRNGIAAMRFANQSEDRITDMVQNYVSEEGMVQQVTTMPQQTFTGEKLPTTKGELEKQSVEDRTGIPQNIQGVHKKKMTQTGYGGTAPLKIDTSAPPIIAESRGNIQGQSDPKNEDNIPAHARALGENVNAWTSPDKAVGARWVSPTTVNEDNIIRDGKDTVQKVWGELTGGDGMVDGEKLNDNMKRETAVSVQINNGSK